jgi:hypothetical protein
LRIADTLEGATISIDYGQSHLEVTVSKLKWHCHMYVALRVFQEKIITNYKAGGELVEVKRGNATINSDVCGRE